MAYLAPNVVAQAARALFKTGHSNLFAFFCLKAAGISTECDITISSTVHTGNGFELLAEQPPGFDTLVGAHMEDLGRNTEYGLPTRPTGTNDARSTYSLFCPLTDKANYLLRKSDSWRSVVWTQVDEVALGQTQNAGNNLDKGDKSGIYRAVKHDQGRGATVTIRLVPGYEEVARWNLGPDGAPLHIPLRELAIWVHRNEDLVDTTSVEDLVELTIGKLNITPLERDSFFDEATTITLSTASFVPTRNVQAYFEALCLPAGTAVVPVGVAPTPESAAALARKKSITPAQFYSRAAILGLSMAHPELLPETLGRELLDDDEERNILLHGPPRTGKSYTAIQLAAHYLGCTPEEVESRAEFRRVQFHLNWGYGDFMRKLTPTANEHGQVHFIHQDGAFLQHCQTFKDTPSVFVIEEINRAHLGQVLGEAFHLIEKGYRGKEIQLPGSLAKFPGETLMIPPDMLIIGTANTIDISTQRLDIALVERFASIEVSVRPNEIYRALLGAGWSQGQAEAFVQMLDEAAEITNFPLGHALFYGIGGPKTAWRFYRTRVRPTLEFFLPRFDKGKLADVDGLFGRWQDAWAEA